MFITRGVLKGDGYRIGGGISPYLSHPPSLRQDAYSTRRLQEPPLRAPRDVVILHYFFEPTRARRAPAAAGPGTHPKKQAAARSRRRPERARSARALAADAARKKLTRRRPRPRRRPGPAGRARPSWPRRGARDRCRLRPDAIAPRPGRFRRLTRGPSSGPPDARPARQSDAAPQLRRAASRGAARRGRAAGALGRPSRGASRVFAALAALTGPKRWLCARAAPALAERSVAQGF